MLESRTFYTCIVIENHFVREKFRPSFEKSLLVIQSKAKFSGYDRKTAYFPEVQSNEFWLSSIQSALAWNATASNKDNEQENFDPALVKSEYAESFAIRAQTSFMPECLEDLIAIS